MAIALYYTGDYRHALAMGEEALRRSPADRRLRENLRLIRQKAEQGGSSPTRADGRRRPSGHIGFGGRNRKT